MTARQSPLHPVHQRLGARFVAFGEWEMPLQYGSVIAEHLAVRTTVGWFDVSHLGRFRWEGPGATSVLQQLLCNDITRIDPGRTQYSMMLNQGGGVVDDLIVWRWGEESYWVLPNAANHQRVMAAFAAAGPQVELEDLRPLTVTLAVQGPQAPGLLQSVLGEAPRRFRTLQLDWRGQRAWTAGTGYTGERGGEVVVPNSVAPELVEALAAGGATPCGLGARDTLRLEAGLPLWGQDLDEETSPLEAGMEFVVSWDHDFVGRSALERQRQEGLGKKLVAFRTEGRVIPRHGYRLRAGSSRGVVTSGNFSPVLQRGIGLGYLSPPEDQAPPEVEIRGRWTPVERVELPFLPR